MTEVPEPHKLKEATKIDPTEENSTTMKQTTQSQKHVMHQVDLCYMHTRTSTHAHMHVHTYFFNCGDVGNPL